MKDCDVTWLYGPLSIGVERISARPPPSPAASPAEREPKVKISKTKPILKKRSMSEIMLQRSISTSSLLKQATAAIESQQANYLYPQTRPAMVARANSDYCGISSPVNSAVDLTDMPSVFSTGCQSPSARKHIHFNNQVQQCIAVETDEDDEDGMYGATYDADDSSSDDGIIMMARSSSNRSNRSDRGSFSETQTIAHLPSTTLKYKEEPVKKTGGFISLNSLFASKPASTPKPACAGTKQYVLEDDEDMSGLDWEPNAFAGRRDSVATARPKSGNGGSGSEGGSEADDFQLPNFNAWEDDEANEGGIFGRAVEAVNTARDIAHVLWNVGWRR